MVGGSSGLPLNGCLAIPFPAPSSLGRGQETIEMCETQLGLYMIMDPDIFSRDQYQRPAIIMPSNKKKVSFFKKFVCHKVRSIEGQDVVRC